MRFKFIDFSCVRVDHNFRDYSSVSYPKRKLVKKKIRAASDRWVSIESRLVLNLK